MDGIFVGTEAVARGLVTPGQLRYGFRRVFPNVYTSRDRLPSLADITVAAWLWSGRRAVITGRAAAALHGAKWVDPASPIEVIFDCKRPPDGIIARNERLAADEVVRRGGLPIASTGRAAFDLARHLPLNTAVTHLDALANATGLDAARVRPLLDRYGGARGLKTARRALELMDGGAQSPRETWLRLLLMKHFPRPRTQIPLHDSAGIPIVYLDMGWDDAKIAVEYDGSQHQTDRSQYVWDEGRLRVIRARRWLHVKVIKEDRPSEVIARVRYAWALRESASSVADRAS